MSYKVAALLTAGITALLALMPTIAAAQTTANAKAMLILSPDSGNVTVGDTLTVKVLLDTKGEKVSQVDFRLKYNPALLSIQDSDQERAGIQIEDGDLFEVLLSTNPVNQQTGIVEYSKISLSENKYYETTVTPGEIASIQFKALKSGTATVNFESTTTGGTEPTKIYRASDEAQILGEVTNAEFTIRDSATVSAQQTPTPSASSTVPSATPSAPAAAQAKPSLSLLLDKSTLKADGKETANVKVSLKDATGKPLANSRVLLSVTGSATVAPAAVTTSTTGEATATVTAGATPGAIVVAARLESNQAVSASSQIASTQAAVTAPIVKPVPTPLPVPVAPPARLDQVGPASTLALSMIIAFVTAVVLQRRRTVRR